MMMKGGRVQGNQRDKCHTKWPENTTNTRGGKEGRSREMVERNGQKRSSTRWTTRAMWVLNQGRSQGRLQVVEKVVGSSQSEYQGGQKGQKWQSQEWWQRGRRNWIMTVTTSCQAVIWSQERGQRGRRHWIMTVTTSCQAMIWHQKSQL
jgi:hypothetical protein